MKVTVFKSIYSDQPHYQTVDQVLARIKNGKSKLRIEQVRAAIDKERADAIKAQLPSVCFSGEFSRRTDDALLTHSGFICLDFDNVEDIGEAMGNYCQHPFVYAAWLSPRGNGLKVLVKI